MAAMDALIARAHAETQPPMIIVPNGNLNNNNNGALNSNNIANAHANNGNGAEAKKKKHRHTRTWAGPAQKIAPTTLKEKAREEADRPKQSLVKAPPSPYLSEEERAAFVRSPQLLNDASFEPRVIKGASPYVPKTMRKSRDETETHSRPRRASNDKDQKRSGDELLSVEEETAAQKKEMEEESERIKRREESKIYQGIHRRYNSMHTLHLASVLHSPDVHEILHCFSRALYGNLKLSETVAQPVFLDVYSELVHPLNEGSRRKMPSAEEILAYVTRIYTGIALAPENLVMALAYVERLVALTNVTVHPTNWRRIVLAALLLASKVWEDLAVHNRDLLRVFPQLKLRDVLELEHAFLEHLQFTVSLKASVYAKYYFELRTLSELDEHTFPLKPLGEEGALLLEARSRGAERKVAEELSERRTRRRRTKSFTALPLRDKSSSAPMPMTSTSSMGMNLTFAQESPAPNGKATRAIGFDSFAQLTHAQRAPTHAHHRH